MRTMCRASDAILADIGFVETMNIHQANNLDFPDVLSRLGYAPVQVKKGGADLWYRSPFRPNERTPSFHLRKGKTFPWVWHDFAHPGKSTVLDFIVQYKGTDKKGALAFLDSLYPNYRGASRPRSIDPNQSDFGFSTGSVNRDDTPQVSAKGEYELVGVLPIKSEAVYKYLESRRISRRTAFKTFKLVQYRKSGQGAQRPYFGFGMATRSGWEVRSATDDPVFKTAVGSKDISIVIGSEQGRGGVSVFEGMTDYASLLCMLGVDQLRGDAIILHGLGNSQRAIQAMETGAYERIFTFLDNNPAGVTATEALIQHFAGRVLNYSPQFLPHTDLNDAWRGDFSFRFERPVAPAP